MTSTDVVVGEFFVPGRARTKGSLKPILSRGARGKITVNLIEQTEHSKPWKLRMIAAIRKAYPSGVTYAAPVEVRAEFIFEREHETRSGVAGTRLRESSSGAWPVSIIWGDLDKLERNLLDALTQSGLIADDRLVVAMQTRKRFAEDGEAAGVRCLVLAVGDE